MCIRDSLYTEKFLRMDYADCDRQETRDLFSQIRQNADWSGWGFAHLKLYYTDVYKRQPSCGLYPGGGKADPLVEAMQG